MKTFANPRNLRNGTLVVFAILSACLTNISRAASYYYMGSTNGSWTTVGNWSTNSNSSGAPTVAPGASDDLFFNMLATNSVPNQFPSISAANRAANSITFGNAGTNTIVRSSTTNTTANTLTIAAGITNLSTAGPSQISRTDQKVTLKFADVASDFIIANNSSNSLTFFGQTAGLTTAGTNSRTILVSGTGIGIVNFDGGLENGSTSGGVLSLRISNTGAVQLGASTFTGGTILDKGTIALASGSALGTGGLTINGGAIGSVTSARTITNNITVNGNFGLGVTNAGFSGQTTTLNGNMDLGASTRTITMLANSATIGGVVSGAGGLIVESSSATRVLNLTNANTYTGATTINGGIFRVNGTLASSSVTVNTGATLGGSGTISGDTIISSGAFLAPGNSPGLLTFGNNLTLAGEVVMELNGTTTRGTDYDAVNVGNLLTYGGKLTLSLTGTYTAGATFNLFDFASTAGSFTSIDLNGSYTGSLVNNLGTWTGTVGGVDWQFTENDGIFQAVPEPSTYALIGMAAAAFAGYSIRRRKRAVN